MNNYSLSTDFPQQQYIQIRAEFSVHETQTLLQFPAWRPGRYELGNFAKNVRSFQVFDQNNRPLAFKKTKKDEWCVETTDTTTLHVRYSYYSVDLNAGSTYLDDELLYVNPVNCCVYIKGRENEPCQLTVNVPEGRIYAGGLPNVDNTLTAENYHQLVDSPFVFAKKIQHNTYEVNGILFHLWFHGAVNIDWERLISDFSAFTTAQLRDFSEFPVKEYHFLYLIQPNRAYHGVEHLNSTVIVLGPGNDLFGSVYEDLLGVSSHELYHTWNVKSIRPIEMYPYDYSKENYSSMGYLCEGVTTYMGDYYLYKSGVFTFRQYLAEIETLLNRHFENFGRFHYSVAESSWDTWLDGYTPGTPGRKVSIYNEGALIAFITDLFIMQQTDNRKSLSDLMRYLYFNFYLYQKGVSETDFLESIKNVSGGDMQLIFDQYIHGKTSFESILTELFDMLGFEMIAKPVPTTSQAKIGIKTMQQGEGWQITHVFPGSDADAGGLMVGDKIMAINNYFVDTDIDKWFDLFQHEQYVITINRKGKLIEKTLPQTDKNCYLNYKLKRVEKPSVDQLKAFRKWTGKPWEEV
jgi:predicted metalloprotease with PDZ domain